MWTRRAGRVSFSSVIVCTSAQESRVRAAGRPSGALWWHSVRLISARIAKKGHSSRGVKPGGGVSRRNCSGGTVYRGLPGKDEFACSIIVFDLGLVVLRDNWILHSALKF